MKQEQNRASRECLFTLPYHLNSSAVMYTHIYLQLNICLKLFPSSL